MKTFSVKLEEGLAQRLSAAARRQRTSKSNLVRHALEIFLDDGKASRAESCLHLAADLFGSVEAPEDLSVNRSHLNGFGT